ncbi:MAG: hypothetical protein IJ521_02675, partial [Schwartzia sp.]|nr:hypothetical protein [Schwartzia sp. (in: firmicutes)]
MNESKKGCYIACACLFLLFVGVAWYLLRVPESGSGNRDNVENGFESVAREQSEAGRSLETIRGGIESSRESVERIERGLDESAARVERI